MNNIRPILPNAGPPVGQYVPAEPPLPGEFRFIPTFGKTEPIREVIEQ